MTDATYGVTNEQSSRCCPASPLEFDWITSYCDEIVEGHSANSQLTWSSRDSVSEPVG